MTIHRGGNNGTRFALGLVRRRGYVAERWKLGPRIEVGMDNRKCGLFFVRAASLGILWWILTRGDPQSWWFGGPVILIAASWRLGDSGKHLHRWRPWRLATFVPYFLWRSFIGSCDVAWRAMHWRVPITPVIRPFVFRLPPSGPARVFCASCF